MKKIDIKLKKLRKTIEDIRKLEIDVRKEFPPMGYLLVWTSKMDDWREVRIKEHYTLKEALAQKEFMEGVHPEYYHFYVCQIIK